MAAKRSLSEKQVMCLRLVNRGLSNQEIAERLSITLGTTKWHLHQIFSKLRVRSRTAAAAMARRRKII